MKWTDGHWGVGKTTAQIVEVTLPNGDPVLVSVRVPGPGSEAHRGTQDVAIGEVGAVIQAGLLPGFTETIRGVVSSVQHALEQVKPDAIAVEFGIEITARAGRVLSVLAETGGHRARQRHCLLESGQRLGTQP